jgi:acyl-coenzyme A thioesterase PaaI-like protein
MTQTKIGGGMTSVDPEQTEAIRQLVPFAAALGVKVVTSSPNEVRARVEWRPERCTTAGVLHGGVIMTPGRHDRRHVRVPEPA